ncbi:hypothetical protein, partial [Shewanella algae]|uniref:hypothetical protein n=1 Tax=Shewanella algae TaxID=38313 RepID=UPI0031F5C085
LFILLKSNPLGVVAIGSGLRILRFPAAASRGIYHLFSPVVERTQKPFFFDPVTSFALPLCRVSGSAL